MREEEDEMRLNNKVALVTGGAGGLGGATARLFAKEGAKVVTTDVADAAGTALAAEIGGSYHHLDVSSEAAWTDVMSKAVAEYGKIDILVNAAGIEGAGANGGGLNTTLDDWRKVLSINLDGTFLGCKAVMPSMIQRGEGSVINISSIITYMGTPTLIAYGASKAGVEQMTRSLAIIGSKDGNKVRCNTVHPGIIKTRMTDNIFLEFGRNTNQSDAEVEAMLCEDVLFGKRGEPLDVANPNLFLASDESKYITGSAFKVDGGWSVIDAG